MIRTRTFNMIEVTLAIAVVAVGLVSVMALFPIGSNLSRDMMAETYAAQAADHLLNVTAFQMRAAPGQWAAYIGDAAGSGGKLNGNTPTAADRANFDLAGATNPSWDSGKTLYIPDPNDYRHYKIIRYRDTNKNGEYDSDELLDFEGIGVLWQDDSEVLPADRRDIAATLKLELTWPAALPPERRQSAVYQLEVFNR